MKYVPPAKCSACAVTQMICKGTFNLRVWLYSMYFCKFLFWSELNIILMHINIYVISNYQKYKRNILYQTYIVIHFIYLLQSNITIIEFQWKLN